MKTKRLHLISDPHFGNDIIANTRGFKDASEFYQTFVRAVKRLSSHDSLIILGDLGECQVLVDISAMMEVHIVLGNHDTLGYSRYQDLANTVNAMVMLPHSKIVMTHFPVHPSFFDGKKADWRNVHGHLHQQTINDPRYINVSVDQCLVDGEIVFKKFKDL